MHLRSDMVGDEPHDPLAVGGRQSLPGIRQAFSQPVHPETTVGIEHHLHDGRIFEPRRDGRPKRGAQHSRAARDCFHPE